MDPLSMVTSAVIMGAAAAVQDTAGQAVKDAYGALKTLIARKFARAGGALDQLEQKPDSQNRQGVLREELEDAGAAADAEVQAAARRLLALLEAPQATGSESYHASVKGGGAIAQGKGARAAGAGGVIVGGNVEGGIHTSRPADDEET